MSIQTEINRLASAKSALSSWLLEHDVRISLNAKLNELVGLLDTVSTGDKKDVLVPVTVNCAVTALISKTVLPVGAKENSLLGSTSSSYRCPANSMLVLYGTCNGGTSTAQAYPTVNVTGDLTSEVVYYTASSSSSTRPMGIFVIHVGTEGGAVTFTRATSKNAIM